MEVNTTCVSPEWISVLVNGTGRSTRRWKSHVGTSPRRFGGPPIICYICFAKEPATLYARTLDSIDPSLTLTRTQYPATVGDAGNRKPLRNTEIASVCNA